jgi:hypothetical protein
MALRSKIWPAYQEVQASNLSQKLAKLKKKQNNCRKKESRSKVKPATMRKVDDRFVVYRSRDRKVMKNINYFRPNLKQFFTDDELRKIS